MLRAHASEHVPRVRIICGRTREVDSCRRTAVVIRDELPRIRQDSKVSNVQTAAYVGTSREKVISNIPTYIFHAPKRDGPIGVYIKWSRGNGDIGITCCFPGIVAPEMKSGVLNAKSIRSRGYPKAIYNSVVSVPARINWIAMEGIVGDKAIREERLRVRRGGDQPQQKSCGSQELRRRHE